MPTSSRSLLLALSGLCLLVLVSGCRKKGDDDDDNLAPYGLDSRPPNPTCLAPSEPPPSTSNVALASAFGGETFFRPVLLRQHPTDDDRWYVVRKDGIVETLLASDPSNTRTTFVDLSGVGQTGFDDERGLLGMAFHPDFANNGYVYLSYQSAGDSHVVRYTSNDDGLTLDLASLTPIFSTSQPYANHNGGMVEFGPFDGDLYIGLGDGGSGGDPQGNGQNTDTVLGSILRIDVDGGDPYAIPPDNPFASGGGAPEIFAWGLRNPWRFSFDPATGDLWVGDVGQNAYEEISLVKLGGNYGWDAKEADSCFSQTPFPCDGVGYTDPVAVHPQNEGPFEQRGESMTGGYVYRGSAMPELTGVYIYGDYVTQRIWALRYNAQGEAEPELLLTAPGNISSFGQGRDGEIYVLDYANSEILQIVPNGNPPPSDFPMTLSETGCMDSDDVTKFYSGVIPYGVVQPFWSDGATKERGMALPNGETIDIQSDGDFDFPVGTVLIKNFYKQGEQFETRLFVRHDNGNWAGYTYQWRSDLSDADLVQGGKLATVAGDDWLYPSGPQCLECHSEAAGRSLGPEIKQLNRSFVYESTGRESNQLATLEHIGMFSAALPDKPASLPSLPPAFGNDPVDQRARTYVQVNCSMCHRPDGPALGDIDFRFETAFADMSICNVDPQEGDLGVAGAKLFTPGDPDHSIISLRMKSAGEKRMPKIGTITDTDGVDVLDAWINATTGCP